MTVNPPQGLGARFEFELGRWRHAGQHDSPNGTWTIVLRDGNGEEFEGRLSDAQVHELNIDLARATHERQQLHALLKLANSMASVIVAARCAGEDIPNLIGYCLQATVSKMAKPWKLTAGRSGSWKASCVHELIESGGQPPRREDLARELINLLTTMGHQGNADGGDLVSYALGRAAIELGSVDALLGDISDDHSVYKLAVPYAEELRSPGGYRRD